MYEELQITHVSGPMELATRPDSAVVLCLVRNGGALVDDFIEHHLSAGFSHIAFMDNRSEDDTISRAARHKHVTVLRSPASYQTDKLAMKHALFTLFGYGAWSLTADIDEFFQFPLQDEVGLPGLIKYLNQHRFTCMLAHMVDMIPNSTIGELLAKPVANIHAVPWYFDVASIERRPFGVRSNHAESPDVKLWYGGVRRRLFGLDDVYLSKHALNFGDGKLILFNGHEIGNRRVADVTGLFLHYKYVGGVQAHARLAVSEKNYYNYSKEYRRYLEVFENSPDRHFLDANCVRYSSHRQLEELNLYTVSPGFQELGQSRNRTDRDGSEIGRFMAQRNGDE